MSARVAGTIATYIPVAFNSLIEIPGPYDGIDRGRIRRIKGILKNAGKLLRGT